MARLQLRVYFSWLCFLALGLTGCTAAVPEVKSLLSSFNLFSLRDTEARIDDLALLSSINIYGTCDGTNTGFEYELVDQNPGVWISVPTSSSSPFTSVANDCSSSKHVQFQLDLSGIPAIANMSVGQSRTIRFRDTNLLNLPTTQEFRIVYSQVKITDADFIQGQGYGQTATSDSGDYTLKGRVITQQKLDVSISNNDSNYTLQGKASFE